MDGTSYLKITVNIKFFKIISPLFIMVDGNLIKEIYENGTYNLNIPPGGHTIQAKAGWFTKSNRYISFINDNQSKALSIKGVNKILKFYHIFTILIIISLLLFSIVYKNSNILFLLVIFSYTIFEFIKFELKIEET